MAAKAAPKEAIYCIYPVIHLHTINSTTNNKLSNSGMHYANDYTEVLIPIAFALGPSIAVHKSIFMSSLNH